MPGPSLHKKPDPTALPMLRQRIARQRPGVQSAAPGRESAAGSRERSRRGCSGQPL